MKIETMNSNERKKRIIWAIDALEPPGKLQANAVATLKGLASAISCEIEPVYIMSQIPEIGVEYSFQWSPQHRSMVEDAAEKIVKKCPLPNLLPPKLLEQSGSSNLGAVDQLATYAARQHATMIVANTHSKTGLKRFFLGSFAEALTLRSTVPVIVVGPHIPKPKPLKKILHPTDFTTQARLTFNKVVDLARDLNAQVVLLHVIPFSLRPYTSANILFPGSYWGLYQDYMRAAIEEADRTAEAWKKLAERRGVAVDSIIDRRGRSVWEAIVDFSKRRGVGLIAMESQTGPMASAIMGSVTRQVLRHSHCPVWTFHPGAKARARIQERPRRPSTGKRRRTTIRSGPRTKITPRTA
jgi:nucleotide-binding universal stress UspA family protein